ncbi:MAG: S41 family peptidase [Saprospiraceae bacterium]|jgi:carboxyl-terminal processing protease
MHFKIILISIVALLGVSATSIQQDKLYEISKNIEIFINVYKELNANYVDDLDPNQLMRVGLDAMVASLDPYTNYISESQVASYMINTEGRYEGIGAIVEKIGDYVTIVEPYEGSPVLEVGLKAGDMIIGIEGQSTLGKSREEVTSFYRGVPGTKVRLKIQTPKGEIKDVDVERSEVSTPNVPYSGFVSEDIGYIALSVFTADASKNIKKALKDLKEENSNIKGLILDLRDNGGGLLREAINISNIFIPKDKEVVSVKSKVRERDETYRTMTTPDDTEIPLVILINKNSASASEIVSGVIQDYDRGVLMGQRSYGKGLVQNTREVGYNSRIKLTTSKYYIPSGRCIQSVMYEDGEPVDIPDDKRSKFKTSNGRIVLDGGGISPDVKLDLPQSSELLSALKKDYMIFKFTNAYIENVDTSMANNEIVFDEFNTFISFLEDQKFSYETEAEELLNELRSQIRAVDVSKLDQQLKIIDQSLNQMKMTAYEANKSAIIDAIEIEIATRLAYQRGKAFQRLKNDAEIDEAVKLLNDPARYQSILMAK